jgi:hypothetical protein
MFVPAKKQPPMSDQALNTLRWDMTNSHGGPKKDSLRGHSASTREPRPRLTEFPERFLMRLVKGARMGTSYPASHLEVATAAAQVAKAATEQVAKDLLASQGDTGPR